MVRLLCALLGALSAFGWASASLAQDVTPPSVTSITMASGPSSATTETFTVMFSESVTGVDLGDFVLTPTGSAAGTIAGLTGSGATYTVSVTSITGIGSLRLDLNSSGTGIQDGASNAISGGYTSGDVRLVGAPATAVPTMTEWAMILLGLMLAGVAALTIQRRRMAV